MTQWASTALMFLGGAVAPARKTVERSYTGEAVAASLRLPGTEGPFFTPGFPSLTTLLHGVRVTDLSAASDQLSGASVVSPYVSDTRQLTWTVNKDKKGLVIADTDRWQALI